VLDLAGCGGSGPVSSGPASSGPASSDPAGGSSGQPPASYGAVFGDIYIKIGGLTYVTAGQGKQIIELLDSKL